MGETHLAWEAPGWVNAVVAVTAGLLLSWIVLLVILAVQVRRHGVALTVRDAARLGPDLVRLVGRLVRDRAVPGRTRAVLALLGAYLLCPIDLVPDVIPVLGYADDALVAALALRVAIHGAGLDAVKRHWPGTGDGLTAVLSLTGLAPPAPP